MSLCCVACGPKPKPNPIPVLPGDGDANTAKPPVEGPPVAVDPWTGKSDMIGAPAAATPVAVNLPPIDELKLSNGLQVYVVKSDRLPVVSMQLAIKAGRMEEAHARLGVSEATANMLVKGTKKRTALQIAKAIDFVGGTIRADSTYEATLLSCSVLSRDMKTCLDLLPDMLTQPAFPQDELQKVKDDMTADVRQRLDDAGKLASMHVQNLLWGNDHVRGWINSEASIAAIDRDAVLAWHKAWFVPENAILVVAGDVDSKKLKGDLERAFGGWKKGPTPPAPTYKEPTLSGSRIRLVDKPGQTQTHIRIAQFGIKHDDPRFFDTLVWNYTLGGGAFSSRLMKVVRVEGGKTYGASSSFDRNMDKGSFVATTFTRNKEAVATTKLMLGEIAKMAKEGPSDTEVAAAISNIAGGYGLRFQSASDVGGALLGAELHNFGREYLANYSLAVAKVDQASAKRAASEILDPNSYVIVMVGDAKDLEPQLKAAGWRYDKVAFTDPVSPEPVRQDAPVDPKDVVAAHKLVDAAIAAKGGKAKLASIKSFKMVAEGTTSFGPQTLPVVTERVFVLPDRMRIDATIQNAIKVIIAVNGKNGWQSAPDPQTRKTMTEDLHAEDLDQIDFERWREPELILLKAADDKAKLRLMPDETIDGNPQSVIKLRAPDDVVDLTIYIDKKTKLVTRTMYSADGRSETDDFADYRTISGVKVAFKRNSKGTGDNARSTDLVLKTVEVDPKIDDTFFDKPAAAAVPAPPDKKTLDTKSAPEKK
ncbi:MAG TPA: insulinase family protein [Kofleriaceae bacterium]